MRGARIIANPGCYPTAAQLPLLPLLSAGQILKEGIIIDAKSGATGAGRAPKEGTLFCEVADGLAAYGIASHRCAPNPGPTFGPEPPACASRPAHQPPVTVARYPPLPVTRNA